MKKKRIQFEVLCVVVCVCDIHILNYLIAFSN